MAARPLGHANPILAAAKSGIRRRHLLAGAGRTASRPAPAPQRMLSTTSATRDSTLEVLEGAYEKIPRRERRGLILNISIRRGDRTADRLHLELFSRCAIPEFLAAAQHREPCQGAPPQTLDQGELMHSAVSRDAPHRGQTRRRKRAISVSPVDSGATLYFDSLGLWLLTTCSNSATLSVIFGRDLRKEARDRVGAYGGTWCWRRCAENRPRISACGGGGLARDGTQVVVNVPSFRDAG